jgi:hypothetical protein
VPALRCGHPVPICPRGIMSYVLLMPTLKVGHPVKTLIQMEANNLSRGPDRFCSHGFQGSDSTPFYTFRASCLREICRECAAGCESRGQICRNNPEIVRSHSPVCVYPPLLRERTECYVEYAGTKRLPLTDFVLYKLWLLGSCYLSQSHVQTRFSGGVSE